MNFKRNKVASALAYLAGVGGALAVSGVHAQQTDQASNPDIRVEVTGTSIRRVEGETALPVTVITRKEIEKSGATSAMELLQLVSSNNSLGAINLSNSVGATTFSAQTASLRGLGGGRTLVLLNGHRLEGFAGEIQGVQGVNLAGIPFEAIERVEILKDGASAIYGSDAIAGVINFITKTDYTGAEVTAMYGTPTRGGGGDQYQGSGSFGIGNLDKDKYNFFASLSYNEQKPLDQRSRDFSNTDFRDSIGLFALSSNQFPGNVTTGHIGVVNHGVPDLVRGANGCGYSAYIVSEIYGPLGCYFDPARAPGVEMIPHDKLYNAFAKGTFQLNDDWQAALTGIYSHDETRLTIQPGPISNVFKYGPNNTPGRITLQPTSPFYPHAEAAAAGVDGQPLNVRYRTYENGLRDTTDTNSHGEFVASLKGTVKDWDVDASAFYSEGKTVEHVNGGFQDYRLLLPLLNSGNVNLFGFNTPDIVQQLRATNFIGDALSGESKSYGGNAKTSGEIFKLPAGPVSLAFGADTRKETLDQRFADALHGGYITGYGGQLKDVSGSRTQWAGFTELDVPIVKTLEGDVQARYDHYSDFGGTTNPKVSLRWQPTKSVLLRSSWGTGFLAPSLYQLFTPNITGVSAAGLSDPIRCPVTGNTGIDCRTQFPVLFGGNASLKPEESEQFTAGVVLEPIPGASLSVDYFKINLKNAITNGLAPAVILGDLGKYGGLITRGPVDPAFPNLPGPITQILQTYLNLGGEHIQGLDIDARYRMPEYNWGRVTFEINGTYYLRYDTQNTDGTWSGNIANEFGSAVTGVIPRWKHYATLTWERGPWSATVAQTFQGSYTDQNGVFVTGDPRTVGSMSLWDLSGTYTGIKNTKLTLGVKNLFDTNPPASNQASTFIGGFDPSYYDPRARFVYGSVNYKFK
ncbi:MAG: TonB-dependent receptor [Betaproteobacteria bacterium]|nr:TonB-dependent receptor [Betaproteobacteria bacterium]